MCIELGLYAWLYAKSDALRISGLLIYNMGLFFLKVEFWIFFLRLYQKHIWVHIHKYQKVCTLHCAQTVVQPTWLLAFAVYARAGPLIEDTNSGLYTFKCVYYVLYMPLHTWHTLHSSRPLSMFTAWIYMVEHGKAFSIIDIFPEIIRLLFYLVI